MSSWLVWFLVACNVFNMVFDLTITVKCGLKWLAQRRYEMRRGVKRYRRVEADPDYYPNPKDCG